MENKRYIYAGGNITTNMRNVPAIPVNMDIKTKLAVVILFSAVISLCLIVVVHRQKRNEALQSEAVLNSVKDGKNVKEMLISKDKNVFKQEQFEKGGERKEIMDQENDPHVERKGGEENGNVGKEMIDDDKYEENEDGKVNDEKDDNAELGKEGDEGGQEPREDRSNRKDIDNEVKVEEENEFDDNEEEVNDNGEEKEEEEDGQFADFHDAEKYFKYANLQMVEEEEDDGEPDEDDPEDGEEHEAFGEENVDDDDGEPNASNELFDDGEDEEYKPIDVKTGKENIEDFKRDEINVVEKDENGRAHELGVDDEDIKNVDDDINDDIDVDDDGNKGDPIGRKKSDNDDNTDDGNDGDGNAGDVDDRDDDENDDEDDNDDDDGIVEEETDIEHKIVHDET